MVRITGYSTKEQIQKIKSDYAEKHGAECPYCKASMKKFGTRICDGWFYCKKCLKYHEL